MGLTNMTNQHNSIYDKVAIFLVLAFCFWCFSIAIHDILYPQNNFEFVQFLLKGDGTGASLSITNKNIVTVIFYLAVVFESLITIVLFIAGILMVLNLRYNKFVYANNLAMLGFAMAVFKYFVLFVTIFSEWFYMWKTSKTAQMQAILMGNFALLGLVFLNLNRKAG